MLTLEEKKEARSTLNDVYAAMTEELYRSDESPTMIQLSGKLGKVRVTIIVSRENE